MDILGEDILGEDEDLDVVGARLAAAAGRRMSSPRALAALAHMMPAAQPSWRPRIAPGVSAHGEGLVPLPLLPDAGGGVFAAALTAINWVARPQRPFRGERLVVNVRRSAGFAAATRILGTVFVGVDLQQGAAGNFDLENFGPTAFGMRLSFAQAEPGVEIRVNAIATPAPAGADTVAVSIDILGRYIR